MSNTPKPRRPSRRQQGRRKAPNVTERAMVEAVAAYQRGDVSGAVACLGSADDPTVWVYLSAALYLAADAEGATRAAVQVLKLDEGHVGGWQSVVRACFLAGAIGRGLEAFVAAEAHWMARNGVKTPEPVERHWSPDTPLAGRRILIFEREGIGELVLLAALVPELLAIAGGVILAAPPRHHGWLSRSFPRLELIETDSSAEGDVWALRPELAAWLRPTAAAFAAHQPRAWIVPDAARVAEWRRRLDATLGPRLKVGLAWRASGSREFEPTQRQPPIEAWVPLLRVPDVTFMSVQHGDVGADLRKLRRLSGVTVHDTGIDPVREITGYIDMLAALDLVVSPDQTAPQLAAATGRPAWIVLPLLADWRWLGADDPSRSLWYPSARLFRQTAWGSWGEPIAAAAAELAALARRAAA